MSTNISFEYADRILTTNGSSDCEPNVTIYTIRILGVPDAHKTAVDDDDE